MDPSQKWILSSGRCVEDIIYHYCRHLEDDNEFGSSMARSFVLDLSLLEILFSKDEISELQKSRHHLPQLSDSLKRTVFLDFVQVGWCYSDH